MDMMEGRILHRVYIHFTKYKLYGQTGILYNIKWKVL